MQKEEFFCPICTGLDESVIGELLDGVVRTHYKVNKQIYLQGEPFGGVFVVLSGMVRLSCQNEDFKDISVERIGPNETFGATGFVSDCYLESALATSGTTCIHVPSQVLRNLLSSRVQFSVAFMGEINRWLIQFYERFKMLSCLDARTRVETYLSEMVDTPKEKSLRLKRHEIASNIGIRPETLSRILKELEAEKLLVMDGSKFVWNPKVNRSGKSSLASINC